MDDTWCFRLISFVKRKGCIILQFDSEMVERASLSKHGLNEFTKTYLHDLTKKISPPLVCFILYQPLESCKTQLNIGVLSSNAAISTFESRIKYKNGKKLFSSLKDLLYKNHDLALSEILSIKKQVTYVKPNLSVKLIELLSSFTSNHNSLQYISESLNTPTKYSNNSALQEDAIQTALRAFGINNNEFALDITLMEDKSTGLLRLKDKNDLISENFGDPELKLLKPTRFIEDNAIAKDVYSLLSRYSLEINSLTGKALFEKNGEYLEIYTANRTTLEQALGVDLIYINLTQKNTVMVQYKMLEQNENSTQRDWIYYPNEKMRDELTRMRRFNQCLGPDTNEYRLNKSAFYLKFVKRDAALKNGSIILPLDHYEKIVDSSRVRGPRKGVRISYNQLKGQYLRQGPFLGLIQSGYIGSYSKTTGALRTIINEIVDDNRAVITAIQRQAKA